MRSWLPISKLVIAAEHPTKDTRYMSQQAELDQFDRAHKKV